MGLNIWFLPMMRWEYETIPYIQECVSDFGASFVRPPPPIILPLMWNIQIYISQIDFFSKCQLFLVRLQLSKHNLKTFFSHIMTSLKKNLISTLIPKLTLTLLYVLFSVLFSLFLFTKHDSFINMLSSMHLLLQIYFLRLKQCIRRNIR